MPGLRAERTSILLLIGLLFGFPLAAQQRTASPHGALKEECSLCHSAQGWRPAKVSPRFDHGRLSGGFTLVGGHAAAACSSCHATLDFKNTPTDCIACHKDIHQGELGSDCARCHTPRSFIDRAGMLRAHQATRFPLNGAHRIVDCELCHTPSAQGQLTFVNRGSECQDCHLPRFIATTNPPHEASGFPHDCAQCHAITTWNAARYNHANTDFPLTGKHRLVPCQNCHANSVYQGAPTTCVGCHQQDYDGTANPPHGPAGFPTTCVTCHTTSGWTGATFDHNATAFPLTGQHKVAPCQNCHVNSVYRGTPTTCVGCHQQDYDATADPPHVAAGFPTTCVTCHTTSGWTGANFDHSGTAFPLTGQHKVAPCQNCHVNSVYRGTPTTCVACHQSDYDATTNPNHVASGFSTSCSTCHTTTGWAGATFNHDANFFPIYSGNHRNQWSSCATCHTNPASYSEFTCLTCHEHSQSSMDSKHQGRSGYSYDSQACYSCHRDGRAD